MNHKIILTSFLICVFSVMSWSQGIVRGKIVDDNGEDLIGVTVVFQRDMSIGTATDFEGLFSIEIPDDTPTVLQISYTGFQPIFDTVQLSNNEVKVLDLVMRQESEVLNEVVVVATQDKSKNYYMEKLKRNSVLTLDYMPADLMKKVGDSEVSSAIARVSGVSTNGGFFSVRGIGDRYVKTTVNGSIIPTLDPFTNNVKLDLFPTSLVDNIVITKTQSPDLPGDWSAAYISVETKDYPEALTINIKTSIGYNPQTTFKNILANETSSTDWLGFDNDFRSIDHTKYTAVNVDPTRYEELVALGLGDYYQSLGITESWQSGSNLGNTYFNLGLVELGLLGKGFIEDSQSATQAQQTYLEGSYQNDAFRTINQSAVEGNEAFANNWNIFTRKAPVNFSQNFTLGNQSKIFGKTIGYLIGMRYNSSVRYDPNSTNSRTLTSDLTNEGEAAVDLSYNQQFVDYSNGWTGLVNANLKLNSNNSVSLLFMPNFKGSNKIRVGLDTLKSSTFNYGYLESQFYEERSQLVYQFKSKHYIPALKTKINLYGSYTDGESSAPDFKDLNYFSDDQVTFLFDKTVSNIRRNFRFLDEDVYDVRGNIEFPFLKTGNRKVSKLKIGGAYFEKQREFIQYDYLLRFFQGVRGEFSSDGLESFFTDDKFTFQNNDDGEAIVPLYYRRNEDPANQVVGHSIVYSGFVMLDQSLTDRMRFSGGLRAEYTDIFSDVKQFLELGYAADDGRRQSPDQSFILTPGEKKQWNYLPSANLVYKLKIDDVAPINLRLNYSRTIARPSIREYTETVVRDFELNSDVFGNADLELVEIDNADLRLESYFQSGDNLSFSLFYKNFKNHIELLNSNLGFTWANADESYVYGIEIEGSKKLNSNFEFRSNITLVNSFTRITDQRLEVMDGIKSWIELGTVERTMFGQAPFVVNAILNYSNQDLRLNASISYNVQGDKLVLTSVDESPDVFELSRHLLNFKIGKSIGEHFDVSLRVRNILDAPIRRSYKYDEGFLLDFDKFNFGPDFNIGISYKL